MNPEVSGTVLFLALLLIVRVLKKNTARLWEVLAIALLFGLSVYISPYTWSFLGILLVLLLGWLVWQKNYALAKRVFAMGGVGALIGVPFAVNYLQAIHTPGYAFAALHQGVLASHQPVLGLWVLVLIAVPLFLPLDLSRTARTLFVPSGLGLLVLLNQQVITGIYLQPGHYHWYVTKPLVGLMLGLWSVGLLEHSLHQQKIRYLLVAVAMTFLFYGAALAQVSFYHKHAPAAFAAQAYAPLLSYLHTQGHQVIYANEDIATYVPVNTPSDAPTNEYANMYLAPVGYFDALTQVEKDPAHASAAALQKLGITLVIVDTKNDTWRIPALPLQTTIADRFAIYRVPASAQ